MVKDDHRRLRLLALLGYARRSEAVSCPERIFRSWTVAAMRPRRPIQMHNPIREWNIAPRPREVVISPLRRALG